MIDEQTARMFKTLSKKYSKLLVEQKQKIDIFIEILNREIDHQLQIKSRTMSKFRTKTPEPKQRSRMAQRARNLSCPVVIPFTKKEIIQRDGLNCYLCNELLTEETATIDHVKPLSRGGWHCPSNAKIACMKCNQKKNTKSLEEYLNK